METSSVSPGRVLGTLKRQPLWRKTALLLLLGVTFAGFVWHQIADKTVTVWDGKRKITFHTMQKTVAAALAEKGIPVKRKDEVFPALFAKLQEGQEVHIIRSFPVFLTVDGKSDMVITKPCTVEDLLVDRRIVLGPLDRINHPRHEILTESQEIRIIRVRQETITEKRTIPYDTVRRANRDLEKGLTRVVQTGKNGVGEAAIQITYENGKEVSRKHSAYRITQAPIDQIIEYGTKDTLVAARGQTIRFERALFMTATAYCPCKICTGKDPGHPRSGTTRLGIPVRPGIVAVDPRVIPLGTRLYVEGYGYALAADTGSAIKGNRIDLFMETHQQAKLYGRHRIKVYVLK